MKEGFEKSQSKIKYPLEKERSIAKEKIKKSFSRLNFDSIFAATMIKYYRKEGLAPKERKYTG